MRAHALVLFLAAFRPASGQSTSALGAFEAPTTFQIAAGANSRVVPSGYTGDIRRAVALDVSVHHKLVGVMDLRFDGWVVDRTAVDVNEYWFVRYRYDQATGQTYELRPTNSWLLAGVISGSFPIHITPNCTIGPTMGIGVVPIARGNFREFSAGENPVSTGATSSNTAQGWLLSGGIAFRWRHLVVEQHVLQIIGADHALGNGENEPFTIGWRF